MAGLRWMHGMVAAALLTGGCGTVELLGRYDLPESPDVAAAPYPRLVDTPAPPAQGSFGAGVPDPAQGTAIIVDLSSAAAVSARRAEILANPALSDAERLRLLRQAGY